MKLSMRILADRLRSWVQSSDIKDGNMYIEGVRFLDGQDNTVLLSQYVYVGLYEDQAVLLNGDEKIRIIPGITAPALINKVLSIFETFNTWEDDLRKAAEERSFQKMIDVSLDVLRNPMIISDMDGIILGLSSAFRDKEINDYWIESRDTMHLPSSILATPLMGIDGTPSSWTDTPSIYILPDGTRTIGSYVSSNGKALAGIGLWEYADPVMPGDVQIFDCLCSIVRDSFESDLNEISVRGQEEVIASIISGEQISSTLTDGFSASLRERLGSPWKLLIIDSPFRSDAAYRSNLLHNLRSASVINLSLIMNDCIVSVVSSEKASRLIDFVFSERDLLFYSICISLPFADIRSLRARYLQTLFIHESSGSAPGLHQGEDFAVPYITELFKEHNKTQDVIHPALDILKNYDSAHDMEFYETLYQYLINERSVNIASRALHIHKNSFLYRMRRIRELLSVDLDDADTRVFLILSYLIDRP